MEYQFFYECTCGSKYFPTYDDIFFCDDICTNCGENKRVYKKKVGRYISDSIWYKPSTWGKSHWEYKE